jgi:hypothetical protein
MDPHRNPQPRRSNGPRRVPTASLVFEDGRILETVHRPQEGRTCFVVWQDGVFRYETEVKLADGSLAVPYSASNNLLRHEVVLFPEEPREYGSEAELVAGIQAFIHRYSDLSPLFERISAYYVLLSWVYDAMGELPYLRVRGDPGSGKTRFLLTVGLLCYKPIFASGASTVSPIFRILDAFRGTLVVDEGDFRHSDERSEIVKILNNGNAKGFPVLRSEAIREGEYDPKAYAVFGPKLVATRGHFEDRALESRCITEEMGQTRLRTDIPINLPPQHRAEATDLRNKLLMFRFRRLRETRVDEALVDRSVEPRLNQILVPLMSVVGDSAMREEMRTMVHRLDGEMLAERGMDTEARVLEVIRDVRAAGTMLSAKEIASEMALRYGEDYDRKVTPKWIGWIIRRRLKLMTEKRHGSFVIASSEGPKLAHLFERYGVEPQPGSGAEPRSD